MISLNLNSVDFTDAKSSIFHCDAFHCKLDGITAVLGENGAGKSLFLEMVQGILKPSSGEITLTHDDASPVNSGYIFQTPTSLKRSVFENVALPLHAQNRPSKEIKEQVMKLLEEVGLADKSKLPAVLLSGGEAQRMGFARALSTNPNLIIMDEPTSNLDANSSVDFETLVGTAQNQGCDFLWASHNLAQVKRLCNDVIFIHKGRIVEHAPSATFFTAPKSEQAQDFLNTSS